MSTQVILTLDEGEMVFKCPCCMNVFRLITTFEEHLGTDECPDSRNDTQGDA